MYPSLYETVTEIEPTYFNLHVNRLNSDRCSLMYKSNIYVLWQVVMPSSKIESTQRYLKMGQPWPPFVLCTGECTSIGITTNLLGLHMQEIAKGVDLIKAWDQALERVAERSTSWQAGW